MFYDAIARFIKLRYHLMPYVYSMAGAVHFEDGTMMRSLLFDFPQDKTAAGITDEFMFGPALLICAVTEPMYYESASRELSRKKSRKCYLPEGCGWYDYWTNRYYEGGQTVEAEAPIDIIPIFVKAGSILPTVRGIQYAGQKPEEPMKICVYPGADAEFTLYEDEGETYGFETGAFVMTTFFWNERLRTLEVKSRKGDYPGWQEAEYTVEICGEQGDIVSCGKKYEK
jgi:alpha-D-xyloside xylohydrolase